MCRVIFSLINLLVFSNLYSQIGIETNNPEAALDINGNLIIQNVANIPEEPISFKNKVLVTEANNVVKTINQEDLSGVEEIKRRVILALPFSNPVPLYGKGVSQPIDFSVTLNGLNSEEITVEGNEIVFPANKVFKIMGFISVKGNKFSGDSVDHPGYITNKFNLSPGSAGELIISTYGFTISSNYKREMGSFNPSIMIFISGPSGSRVQLTAQYFGDFDLEELPYYIAGLPLMQSSGGTLGSYIMIEEL